MWSRGKEFDMDEYKQHEAWSEFINENFCENITIEQLAEIVHLSKSYFMARFRQAAGVGAIEYINQLRIKKACAMLAESNLNASDVAFECGFRNLSNFNRTFKARRNCTPRDFRAMYKKNKVVV